MVEVFRNTNQVLWVGLGTRSRNIINDKTDIFVQLNVKNYEFMMNISRTYRVIGYGSSCNYTERFIECIIRIPVGDDILEKAREELSEKFSDKGLCSVTEIVEITECEGCHLDACGQRDHMLHPDGCLHDPSDCDLCQMEIKNLLKLSE